MICDMYDEEYFI
jgi:hypothetical protein